MDYGLIGIKRTVPNNLMDALEAWVKLWLNVGYKDTSFGMPGERARFLACPEAMKQLYEHSIHPKVSITS
jgi:hypothetical protein